MADNVAITAGTGTTVRAVQKGGGTGPESQVVILDLGGSGTEALLSAGQKALANSVSVAIASDQTAVPVTASAGTNLNTSALALESGGNLATIAGKDFATQTTLSALSAKVPALGQALAAAAVPVVLTAIQQAALTPPAAITGFALDATLSAMSGKLPATLGAKASALSTSVVLASDQAAVPVSAASLPLPTGASTSAAQTTGNTSLASIDGKIAAVNTGAVVLAAGSALVGSIIAAQQSGILYIGTTSYTVLSAFVNATASGDTVVVTGTGGKKIRVLRYKIGPVSAAVNVFFKSSTAGAIGHTEYLAANGGSGAGYCPHGVLNDTATAENLSINLSGTANVGVTVEYILV